MVVEPLQKFVRLKDFGLAACQAVLKTVSYCCLTMELDEPCDALWPVCIDLRAASNHDSTLRTKQACPPLASAHVLPLATARFGELPAGAVQLNSPTCLK